MIRIFTYSDAISFFEVYKYYQKRYDALCEIELPSIKQAEDKNLYFNILEGTAKPIDCIVTLLKFLSTHIGGELIDYTLIKKETDVIIRFKTKLRRYPTPEMRVPFDFGY